MRAAGRAFHSAGFLPDLQARRRGHWHNGSCMSTNDAFMLGQIINGLSNTSTLVTTGLGLAIKFGRVGAINMARAEN
jgi:hypothetical protein